MKLNISKFSWAEMFSNNNGKTSGSGFAGIVTVMVSNLVFLLAAVDKIFLNHHNSDILINQSITLIMVGASLLGLRKFVSEKKKSDDVVSEEPQTTDEPIERING